MSYALYKFHKAILSLYGTELQKRQWLGSSYMHHIIHLHGRDLPEPVRNEFEQIRYILTRVAADNATDTLEQSVKALDNAEVDAVIARIIALYDAIRQHEHAAEEV